MTKSLLLDSGNSIIKIFDDCMEFFNPSKFYDDLMVEELDLGDYSSRTTRSRVLARAFKEAGIIERYGLGIARIKNECKLYGIKEPLLEEFIHGFRVILFKEKINIGINDIYKFIHKNQLVRSTVIAACFNSITKRTIKRWIKQLRDEGKVEFRDSLKSGGYWEILDD